MGFVDHCRDCCFYSELERHQKVLNRKVTGSDYTLEGSSDCWVGGRPFRDKNGSRETTDYLYEFR